jgi:hypothetical protein
MERNIGNRNPSVPICISVGSGQFCAKPRWKLLGAVSGHTKSLYNPQHDQKWFAYATIPYWRLPKKNQGIFQVPKLEALVPTKCTVLRSKVR